MVPPRFISKARRPRVALLGSRGIPARYGGFETFADELAPRLAERGVDVTVFCEQADGPAPTTYKDVSLEYVSAKGPGPLGTILYDLRSVWRARKGFDAVYMLGYGVSFACFLPRLSGSKVWINMDGVEWRRSKWNSLAKLYLRVMEKVAGWTANRLVFDNGALGEEVSARVGGHAEHSVLAYGAPVVESCDPSPLTDFNLEAAGYDLVLCRAEPENHLLEIIEAHERSDASVPLAVVANTDNDSEYSRKVLARASDRIRILGPVYDRKSVDALRFHSRLYLHGHSVGGTNPSLIEAMGSGAFVLAHDNPYNREVLADTGMFFKDVSSLEKQLRRLEDLEFVERERSGSRARDRVLREYGWEELADRYASLMLTMTEFQPAEAA